MTLTSVGAILLLGTGHALAGAHGGIAPNPWMVWSYLAFGLSGVLWLLVLVPIQLRQRVLLKRDQSVTPQYLKLSRIWQISGAIATVVPLPIVYLMIVKGV